MIEASISTSSFSTARKQTGMVRTEYVCTSIKLGTCSGQCGHCEMLDPVKIGYYAVHLIFYFHLSMQDSKDSKDAYLMYFVHVSD